MAAKHTFRTLAPFNEEKNYIGAHISIIYPEERVSINPEEIDNLFSFEIDGLFKAYLQGKKYYVLKVISQDLVKFRLKYGLSHKLLFKGCFIDPHITIAVGG